ncbi:MAG: hypothetical protein H6667_20560 [Ardenticatenaceae bacterium]|nr:hypothetical protein [Ardenticatenaceae bacterium]MCB9445724.1 hypothetical protein [Ardenticatenaceae bacterium]
MKQQAIEQAKQALQKNSFANFATQSPHLRMWLENLPIMPIETLVQQQRAVERAQQGSLDEIIETIKSKWRAYNPPNSHEGAVSAVFGGLPDLLTVTFEAEVWGISSEQGCFTVARIGTHAYLFWPYR